MQHIERIKKSSPSLAAKLIKNSGFLQSQDVDALLSIDRFIMVLVRCGAGRFLTPIQDLKHFIEVVQASKKDYIRDVCLPA